MSSVRFNFYNQPLLRFIMGGGFNIAITYGLYLFLSFWLDYQWSYLIAYAFGIILAYWINTVMVFRASPSWKGFFSYPLIYLIQYGLSFVALKIFVEHLEFTKTAAPLCVIVVMLPITYTLNKALIKRQSFKRNKI